MSTGLKTRIASTLVLLILLGMLLLNLVITVLWQRHYLQDQRQQGETLFQAVALLASLPGGNQAVLLSLAVEGLSNDNGCLAFMHSGQFYLPGNQSCQEEAQHHFLRQALRQPGADAYATGRTRGVFFPAPRYLLMARQFPDVTGNLSAAVLIPLEPLYQRMRQEQKIIFIYIVANLLFLSAIGFFRLVNSTIRPLEHLVELTDRYDGQHADTFQVPASGNEFRKLSSALQSMLERIAGDRDRLRDAVQSLEQANQRLVESQNELVRAEKLASVGRLAAGLAHEIGNPLGIIQGYLGLLGQADLTGEEHKEFISRAEQEVRRISKLVRQLTELARGSRGGGSAQPVRVGPLAETVVELLQPQPLLDHVELTLALDASRDTVCCDLDQVRQVLLNCLLNSVDALEQRKADRTAAITVGTENVRPGFVRVYVRDNGSGIAARDLSSVFDPFFTTKEPGRGTGLGLAVSQVIIEKLGGAMTIESAVDQGTTVFIELPLVEEQKEQ